MNGAIVQHVWKTSTDGVTEGTTHGALGVAEAVERLTGAPPVSAPGFVPFNRPTIVGREMQYMQDALERGHISGGGHYTRLCEDLLSRMSGGARTLLTTSCTHALEMAALLLDVGPGDEIILPSFTFVSTANAFVLRGATPVFADVDPQTLNVDTASVASLVSKRTRAVVPVHYGGVACELDELMHLAGENGFAVVEDNAHGLGGAYQGRPLGSFGALATLSFHETKNVHCGEGGALVVNDAALADRAEILREKGTNRSSFQRGEVDKYTWVDVGSSYVISDLLAAFLFGQLEHAESVRARRLELWQRYAEGLGDWASDQGYQLPVVPAGRASTGHLFFVLTDTADARDRLLRHLAALGINAVFHYLPLHASPMGRTLARRSSCPIAESASARLVRLPLHLQLSDADQDRVIEAVRRFPRARAA